MSAAAPVVFAALSAGIAAFSWRSLGNPRAHGFPRFFAFECLLALILVNAGPWFRDLLAPRQMLASLLLTGALVLAIHGFLVLRTVGRLRVGFADTRVLLVVGAYRYIRHPLYGSLLLLGWGAFLKQVSVASVCLVVAATAFIVATAKVEEAENLSKFGEEYRAFMRKTRMFIPFVL